nr:hypothetical protein [Serratia symbiotica]
MALKEEVVKKITLWHHHSCADISNIKGTTISDNLAVAGWRSPSHKLG